MQNSVSQRGGQLSHDTHAIHVREIHLQLAKSSCSSCARFRSVTSRTKHKFPSAENKRVQDNLHREECNPYPEWVSKRWLPGDPALLEALERRIIEPTAKSLLCFPISSSHAVAQTIEGLAD